MKNSTGQMNSKGNRRGIHPNSLANLRNGSWKKGQSGNPQGESLTSLLRRMMSKPLAKPMADAAVRELFVFATMVDGMKGKPDARREVWERHDGKVTQPIGGEGGAPIPVRIIVATEQDKEGVKRVLDGERT